MQGQRQAKAGKGLAKAGIDRVGKGRFSSEFSQALELFTLGSLISIALRLLIFGIFSWGYGLIKDLIKMLI